MKTKLALLYLAILVFFSVAFIKIQDFEPVPESDVYSLLQDLGDKPAKHFIESTPEQVKQGEEIIKLGRTTKDGKKSKFVSKFYVCTNCHNTEREDPILNISNPDERLAYTSKKGIPFLQATTFWGMVNRESWYNDDYEKKYGDLVEPARNDLKEAIQLCAEVCSQGRTLEDWELDAVLAYLWTLQLNTSDLDLPQDFGKKLADAKSEEKDKKELITELKSHYALKSPATFVSPSDRATEVLEGDPSNGKLIYEGSCQSCHFSPQVSRLILDDSKLTFRKLQRNLKKNSRYALYHILRDGTHPIEGRKPYMPHYTLERMSFQQAEDLKAYIEMRAE